MPWRFNKIRFLEDFWKQTEPYKDSVLRRRAKARSAGEAKFFMLCSSRVRYLYLMLCSSHKGLRTAVPSHWLNLVIGEADLVVQSLFAVLSLFSHTIERKDCLEQAVNKMSSPQLAQADNPSSAGRPH